MNDRRPSPSGLIAAERRRRIYGQALQDGSVKAISLADELGVGINTIRNDLDALHRDGKLLRVHGGAVLIEGATPRPPYSQTRGENLREKSWIASAALAYLPASGSIFIGDGSTTYQFASILPADSHIHVITNALEVAGYIASNNVATVDFAGGTIRGDSLASDWTLSEEALKSLYWDVTFIGAAAIDIARGITTLDRSAARWERRIMEHGETVVVLCDSSKLSRFAYAQVGSVDLIDVLITDEGVSPAFVKELKAQGVEVVVAGAGG